MPTLNQKLINCDDIDTYDNLGEGLNMTTALTVASYIKSALGLPGYNTKKLQKLIYFSQAWSLAWTGKPLISEDFEAWPDGPVVRSVFAEQKYRDVPLYDAGLDDEQLAIIDSVIEHYGTKTWSELVDVTHEHTPWKDARAGLEPAAPSRRVVSQDAIRDFYTMCGLVESDQPRRRLRPRIAADRRVQLVGDQVRRDWQKGLSILADR
ncbi:Panacea domain-containing protein [Frigoribacterium sp. CFBP 13712]|uniref:Panacea domain-containing protein n=1 Tax=Frigoribacterium sp. CFBP 13712 TaxID=2775309 RepID=UPI00178773AD|nr:type II toxin-antitoxin system antitoxin SocA domain-containing protein [Frigoribacterium sp. CFBP 13712]MBD8704908.1 DUF4065 domain-containing protein [Frigoribacterium sp. CFBP 13712]